MPTIKKQDYLKRDFDTIRTDIEGLLKVYFPNEWQDFNVASAGMALVDLLAYVSDLLSYYTDKRFNELFLDGVSEPSSAVRLAKTLGYKVPGVKASSTLIDVTINVPVTTTGPDTQYLPVYRPGMRIAGGNIIFETVNQIDFSSDFSETGVANRKINPVFDATQNILSYNITKQELAVAGQTAVLKRVITEEIANTDFYQVILPENNVLEVLDVIAVPGTNIIQPPSYTDYKNFDYKFYEVDHLADHQVFLEETGFSDEFYSSGKWTTVNRRFTKEFMSDGSCVVTFGNGTPDVDAYQEYISNVNLNDSGSISYQKILDNTSLGEKLPSESTLFVKYRVGGGEGTNIGAQVLAQVSNINAVIQGIDASKNDAVLSSTLATNIIPALGGRGLPNVQEIRYAASSNFAAQERCVTLEDYIARAKQLPGRFGAPFRVNGRINDNKIQLYVIAKDGNGKLTESVSNVMKNNLVGYLSRYRMINDFIEINSARVINLMFEVDLFTDKTYNSNEIKLTALQEIRDYFNVDNWDMGQHIYISQLTDTLREIPGVINVIEIRAYNLDGGRYSNTIISQADGATEFLSSVDETNPSNGSRRTFINYVDNAIYSTPLSMFEVRYPNRDIRVRIA
jgi:hypothetical protein